MQQLPRRHQDRTRLLQELQQDGIRDHRVLEAMAAIPRELFIEPGLADQAYANRPLSIGYGQTISQPYTVAFMAELLRLQPGMRVLEIGGGCGYSAAILGQLVRPGGIVYSLERLPSLAERGRRNLTACGSDEVRLRAADGSEGLPEHAPYDAIVIAAAAVHIPPRLQHQLGEHGRLLLPLQPPGHHAAEMTLIERRGDSFISSSHGLFQFVPLIFP
ncbi:protein-L-isoaspartate(D-aspartate) O-methyltransferase [Spirochaeta africana]|uniref:Protein-L-isoaspartate O-methyltransferase n=1 Tax=Spirochaeta africana (strain ATCC 700263 / DSM 8902 / Z-7692) TaxID=889378 RepID=H9UK43_SPIAZ|nr:protein-L-isoaspartate(D-aspartate) O-methyltransferase [Spirochaeta africana]AFG37886.1 protein-L-isoaspartate and D-aspartate O-methyltransferase [Spirochaeta africana DSM 8902]